MFICELEVLFLSSKGLQKQVIRFATDLCNDTKQVSGRVRQIVKFLQAEEVFNAVYFSLLYVAQYLHMLLDF